MQCLGFVSASANRGHTSLAMAKKVTLHEASRAKLVDGINIVANAVKVTLGPKGRNVVLSRSYGSPEIVNDGATIAREIQLEDPELNLGAKLVQEVASKSDTKAGDGTTTSTLMTQEIVAQGMRVVTAGANPVSLRRGIQIATKRLTEEVKKLATPVKSNEDLRNVATIASGSETMGRVIASACNKTGEMGSIVVEDSSTLEDSVEFSEGLSVDRGFLSHYFVTDKERQTCELKSPLVLVTDKKINNLQELLPILEEIAKNKQSLLIVADDVSPEVTTALVVNKMRGTLDVVAIKAPSFGERRKAALEDIAVATGADFVSSDFGLTLEKLTLDNLGNAERVVVSKDSTTIVTDSSKAPAIQQRIAQIKAEIKHMDSKYDREKAEARVAALAGGIARIKVGAATETEMKDKKLRYEDAINSVRAAMEMGIVPGGGATLLHLANDKLREDIRAMCKFEDEKTGVDIMFRSLAAPMRQIATNAGLEGAVVVEHCRGKPFGYGYNALTDQYENLMESGVIDPAKVTISALENSASIASLVLTTEALVTDLPAGEKSSSHMDE